MSKIGRTVEVKNDLEYLNLGDLRALVELAAGIDDDAAVYCDAFGAVDHLRVAEVTRDVGVA